MYRIKKRTTYIYQHEYFHDVSEFRLIAKPARNAENIMFYSVSALFVVPQSGFIEIQSKCADIIAKTPQIGFKLMKDQIKKLYPIPPSRQKEILARKNFLRRVKYKRKSNNVHHKTTS
jgi:hypothetical protein